MERNLSASFRPKRFSEVVGQRDALRLIMNQMLTGRLPTAWLLNGPFGCGKTTIARIMAVALQCDHTIEPNKTFGDPCDACLKSWFNIHEVNCSGETGVEEMRALIELTKFHAITGKYTVIILDEAQYLSANAQNALLKHMEDPSLDVVWIVVTTNTAKINGGIKDRCVKIPLFGLSSTEVAVLVKRAVSSTTINGNLLHGPSSDSSKLITAIVENEITTPRAILQAVEKFLAGETPEKAVLGLDLAELDTKALCQAIAAGDWHRASAALKAVKTEDGKTIDGTKLALMVCGYLRAITLNSDGQKADAASKAIITLSSNLPFIDGLMFSAVVARLYAACIIMKEAR